MEFASLLVTIFYLPYIKKSSMIWFVPFLAFILTVELTLAYQYYYRKNWPDVIINYCLSIIETAFYCYIFYTITNKRLLQKIILFFLCSSIIAYIIGFSINRSDYSIYLPILIGSGFFLTTIALIYIYMLYADEDSMVLIYEPGFWVALGVSIFFSGTSIVFSLYDFIVENNLNIFGIRLYKFVPRVLCVVLYSSISIAIILCKKKTRISL